jgi:hypothetical protein
MAVRAISPLIPLAGVRPLGGNGDIAAVLVAVAAVGIVEAHLAELGDGGGHDLVALRGGEVVGEVLADRARDRL